jgi:hypothetical protein
MEVGRSGPRLGGPAPIADAFVKDDVVFPSAREKDFASWEACLGDMEAAMSAAIQFLGRPIPFLILLICWACQVWREAVSGVKLEQAAPRGRSTAQNVRRFDGSPKVVDATLRDIDDYAHVV